ncbi:hypothetical protein T265_12497, partial [Opisthorchis viverrini]
LLTRWLKWLEREFSDRKVRGSNPTSATRLPLSRLGQPDSIPALVLPSGGMAARHRKGATAERLLLLLHSYWCFRKSLRMNRAKRYRSLFSSTLPVPSCHPKGRRHEGCDSARLPRPRQERLSCRDQIRTTDLPVRKLQSYLQTANYCREITIIITQKCYSHNKPHYIKVNGMKTMHNDSLEKADDLPYWPVRKQGLAYPSVDNHQCRRLKRITWFGTTLLAICSLTTSHRYRAGQKVLCEVDGPTKMKSFSCDTLPVPNCHATRRKHEGWDTVRLPKPRQGKSRGGGRVRTTDLPVLQSPKTSNTINRSGSVTSYAFPKTIHRDECCSPIRNRLRDSWLRRETADWKAHGSNRTPASRSLLSRVGNPDEISDHVLPSNGMVARHRKHVTDELLFL